MERHLHYEVHGAGEGLAYFSRADQETLKQEYGLAAADETDDGAVGVQVTGSNGVKD